MTTFLPSFTQLSNHELLAEVKRLAGCERQATVQLMASLTEVDARRLYLGEGCASLFTYCTQVLHLSEHAAYGRIEAARAARRFPRILDLLAAGDLTLTAVGLLAPHLTPDNHVELLDKARYQSKRGVEQLVAQIHPRPDVPSSVRKLPVATPAARIDTTPHQAWPEAKAPAEEGFGAQRVPPSRPAAVLTPLAPDRYKIQITVSRETFEKLRRVQDLLRHTLPNGDPAAIVDRALDALFTDLNRT
jgi:hypothetical protein